jgi:hypothetical protein
MKLIYRAADISEAHIVAGLLKSHEIEAHVGGHYLQGGVGDLAAMGFATVHVADEDVDLAMSVIADYEKNNTQPDKVEQKKSSFFASPIFILAMTVLMMLILAIALNDQ